MPTDRDVLRLASLPLEQLVLAEDVGAAVEVARRRFDAITATLEKSKGAERAAAEAELERVREAIRALAKRAAREG